MSLPAPDAPQGTDQLPRRNSRPYAGPGTPEPSPHALGKPADPAVQTELTGLRKQVPGVTGCLIAGVDGLLIMHDFPAGAEPYDLAALAATTFGLGRQYAFALDQGPFEESIIRNRKGTVVVYALNDDALLTVLGSDELDVAVLHRRARPAVGRLTGLIADYLA